MAIKSIEERPRPDKIEIDLTGPDGNIFYIYSQVRKLAPRIGLDARKIIWDEMMEKPYDDALEIFDSYFGDFVTLYR